MKDIDFDELDKAVSSVLGKNTPADKSPTASGDSTSVISPPAANEPAQPAPVAENDLPEPSVSTPMLTSPATTPAPSPDTSTSILDAPSTTPAAAQTAPPIVVRPRGKFMDVMHPSADMNPATPSSSRPTFTTTRPLTPLMPVTPPETASQASTATVDEASALIGAEPAPVEDEPETAPASPSEPEETLLLPAETEDESAESESENSSVASSNYIDPLDVATKASEAASPSENITPTTPFLSDTKVDKRPLGAFGDADEQATEDTPKEAEDDTQTSPAVPLPRELQPDVVQVEAVQEPEKPVSAEKPFAAAVDVAADSDDGRVEGHPLFDTSTYHEPIAAVHAKKTAPWVFWIIGLGVCLLIGAGVGYFLFTSGF